tara:strand:+ start:1044 stop:1247 length:204 start_codon:yes stop_codon:yes gene_type:complete
MFPARFKNGAGDIGMLTNSPMYYSIVDQVEVPTEEGEYVLSWRWDCEESAPPPIIPRHPRTIISRRG